MNSRLNRNRMCQRWERERGGNFGKLKTPPAKHGDGFVLLGIEVLASGPAWDQTPGFQG